MAGSLAVITVPFMTVLMAAVNGSKAVLAIGCPICIGLHTYQDLSGNGPAADNYFMERLLYGEAKPLFLNQNYDTHTVSRYLQGPTE